MPGVAAGSFAGAVLVCANAAPVKASETATMIALSLLMFCLPLSGGIDCLRYSPINAVPRSQLTPAAGQIVSSCIAQSGLPRQGARRLLV
jgi:hypothetical protein